ncbi:hypothetical protein C474_00300 [Halogeometricum pallidum JCM 14848]|uniref:Halobacterial output domain-containing protein n=1 Tax=Halogeometricum pallidum JCM 14848 TaxID=1227487 RepID=M0DHV3_HALPD|nr:HalOD1 output domain-containing protein [Halogeometricum pallidum]ELZ35066.1 hypothetical protein C474_00300 [Halogeometricum pallidum JCM 14848]
MRADRTATATSDSLPEAIVSLVAELDGVAVTDIPPLASVVDPDALVALFDGPQRAAASDVEFDYAGYRIHLRGDGDVRVLEATPVKRCSAD